MAVTKPPRKCRFIILATFLADTIHDLPVKTWRITENLVNISSNRRHRMGRKPPPASRLEMITTEETETEPKPKQGRQREQNRAARSISSSDEPRNFVWSCWHTVATYDSRKDFCCVPVISQADRKDNRATKTQHLWFCLGLATTEGVGCKIWT